MKKFTRFFIVLLSIIIFTFCIGAKSSNFDEYNVYEVYLGGIPLGIDISTEGVIVSGISSIETEDGLSTPQMSVIKKSDILISICGYNVTHPEDVSRILENIAIEDILIVIKRDGKYLDIKTKFVIDKNGDKKLGLFLRDNVSGIGTLTYITNKLRFGALGHHISDNETGLCSDLNRGNIFSAKITGVNLGSDRRAGELFGDVFRDNSIGFIDKNTLFGVFGKFSGELIGFSKIKTSSKENVKQGKAYIYTTIDGEKPDYYEINIVKTNYQMKPDVKSMVISITDKRLIEKTGGIVQGMSGSPIIQNGFLVGAVTHVFISDATKGYGVYIDWMLQN